MTDGWNSSCLSVIPDSDPGSPSKNLSRWQGEKQEKRKKKKEVMSKKKQITRHPDPGLPGEGSLFISNTLFKTLRKKVIGGNLRLREPQAPESVCKSLTETRRHGEFQYKIQNKK
ncbi:MAG: hypothetical protein Kow00108_21250 [Calditrichia bacterium]